MTNSDILYLLAKAQRQCGYDAQADSLQQWAIKECRKEGDNELLIMEAELIVDGK